MDQAHLLLVRILGQVVVGNLVAPDGGVAARGALGLRLPVALALGGALVDARHGRQHSMGAKMWGVRSRRGVVESAVLCAVSESVGGRW